MQRHLPLMPIIVTLLGIGLLSLMDAFMKSASLALGAYNAALFRSALGFAIVAPIWLLAGGRWPSQDVLKVHVIRGLNGSMMALSFFYSLTKLPLAETIAISFIAPVVSLYLAAVMLGEQIQRQAIWGALLGLAGTLVIVGGKFGQGNLTEETWLGLAAIVFSALLYAWNLVLQRKQALVSKPTEITTFYMGVAALAYLVAAPWLLEAPAIDDLREVAISAVLSVGGALALAWAYARAETQVLAPLEYSGFLWASLFGWVLLRENVTGSTVAGTVLIVIGCWISTRRRPEQSAI
ncbi:MAG: DMT family transporter [Alphaproteobacteria bacterium]|nr:MAG: DMT family transporter [Alphaproteobacteria bacterium]